MSMAFVELGKVSDKTLGTGGTAFTDTTASGCKPVNGMRATSGC